MSDQVLNTTATAVKEALATSSSLTETEFNLVKDSIQETIKVVQSKSIPMVNMRDVWAFLESKQQFANWIQKRLNNYGYLEGIDYIFNKVIKNPKKAGAPIKEYYCTIEVAKELGMLEGNDRGRLIRRYYIGCEELAKKNNLNTQTVLDKLLQDVEDLKAKSEVPPISQVPLETFKVHKLNTADGTMSFRHLCELLKVDERTFRKFTVDQKTVFSDGRTWLPHSHIIDEGYMIITKSFAMHQGAYLWPLYTPKGIAWITELWNIHKNNYVALV